MKNRIVAGLLGLAALLCATTAPFGAALAADLRPVYKPMPAPEPIAPFSWTGFYLGLHGGGGFGVKQMDFRDLGTPFLWDATVTTTGFIGGGQVGFNYQWNNIVLGLEADAAWSGLEGHGMCNTTAFFVNCTAKNDFLGTVTGRLGLVMDRTLYYAKGGVAWAHDIYTISNVAQPPLATAFTSEVKDTRMGWTFGMGAEYALFGGWSAKVEYNYMDFGTGHYDFPRTNSVVAASNFSNWDVSQHVHLSKLGINYRF